MIQQSAFFEADIAGFIGVGIVGMNQFDMPIVFG